VFNVFFLNIYLCKILNDCHSFEYSFFSVQSKRQAGFDWLIESDIFYKLTFVFISNIFVDDEINTSKVYK